MSFNIRYYAEMRSKYREIFWRMEIADRSYSGDSEEVTFSGSDPLTITWEQQGDDFHVPIKASAASATIRCYENFKFTHLFTSDPREHRVSIYRNGKLYWRGFITADLYSENFDAPPYDVKIEAIDGFSVLSGIPCLLDTGAKFSGRHTLFSLLYKCIEVLELDLDIADWMDLYAEGMSTDTSPLTQVYLDMDCFYDVYDDPTYRDLIECCLMPFGAQIFQANGALNIRRAKSLYSTTRPLSFYSIAAPLSGGWLVAADGRTIVTASGEPIITSTTRERIDSMWGDDINIKGDSSMELTPALRSVSVSLMDAQIDNIADSIGLFDIDNWTTEMDDTITKPGYIRIDSDYKYITVFGYNEPGAQVGCFEWLGFESTSASIDISMQLSWFTGLTTLTSSCIEIGFVLKTEGESDLWLSESGEWVEDEVYHNREVVREEDPNIAIKSDPTGREGVFTMIIKQPEEGFKVSTIFIYNIIIKLDSDDDTYTETLCSLQQINPANSVDMTIAVPVGDIPSLSNNTSRHALYLSYSDGSPTHIWHTKGLFDYYTLNQHLINTAILFRSSPSIRISGDMRTGKHVDMNTIVQDDKYLNAGFYVNANEISCLNDTHNVELVEMPGLINQDDEALECMQVAEFSSEILSSVTLNQSLVVQTSDNVIFSWSAIFMKLSELATCESGAKIFPSDNSISIVNGNTATIIDSNGSSVAYSEGGDVDEDYTYLATKVGDKVYHAIPHPYHADLTTVKYNLRLDIVDYKWRNSESDPAPYATEDMYGALGYICTGYDFTEIKGDITSICRSDSILAINTSENYCYIHDSRLNIDMEATLSSETKMLSISDDMKVYNYLGFFCIAKRPTLFTTEIIYFTDTELATCAAHTPTIVAWSNGTEVYTYNATTETRSTITIDQTDSDISIVGLEIIMGDLYIVTTYKIYKYNLTYGN